MLSDQNLALLEVYSRPFSLVIVVEEGRKKTFLTIKRIVKRGEFVLLCTESFDIECSNEEFFADIENFFKRSIALGKQMRSHRFGEELINRSGWPPDLVPVMNDEIIEKILIELSSNGLCDTSGPLFRPEYHAQPKKKVI